MIFITLFAIPIVVILFFYFASKKISWKELLVHAIVAAVIAGISTAVCYYSNVSDDEVWNGFVSNKQKNEVSCSHSYQCNCTKSCSKDTNGNESCTKTCQTCYEHSFDVDWDVYTSNGEVINIAREDRQGLSMPSRWRAVKIGEPTSVEHSYTNYIKGSPDSLFRRSEQTEIYKDSLLEYPTVYDYYRMNRFLVESGPVKDSSIWNSRLSDINARIGASKQVNAMVVITTKPREYYYALEEHWIGGKKNDAVLVIGVNNNLQPVWVEVMAWVLDNKFKIILKEEVMKLPSIDADSTLPVFEKNIVSFYQRKPMHDFEYLKASIVPSTTQWAVSIIIGMLFAIGLGIYFHHNDPFGDNYTRRYRYNRW